MTDFAQLQAELNGLITAVNALQSQITAEKGSALGTATLDAQQRLQPAQHAPLNSGQVYVGNGSNVPAAEVLLSAIAARSTNGANQPLVLDGSGKIVEGNLPTSIVTGARFKGAWDADTNTPDLIAGKATSTFGDYYYVSVEGSTNLDGETFWSVGDFAILSDSDNWVRLDNNDDVVSVQGNAGTSTPQKGAVSLALTDFALADDEIAIGGNLGEVSPQTLFSLLENIYLGSEFDFYNILYFLYKKYSVGIDEQFIELFGAVGAGTNKWIGGVLAPNGKIYCVPSNSEEVLVIDPTTNTTELFGNLAGTFKWYGGVLAPNGKIYCVPANSEEVLVIDPTTNTTELFGAVGAGIGKWYGGVLAPNGKIYCVPANSEEVLVIDPTTNTTELFGAVGAGIGKWYGGVLAPNGKIYCVPYDSESEEVLVIDPTTNTTELFGAVGAGTNKWVGGVLAPNGKIYCVPYNSEEVLVIRESFAINIAFPLKPYLNKF